jgi:hypothetical protein
VGSPFSWLLPRNTYGRMAGALYREDSFKYGMEIEDLVSRLRYRFRN